MRLIVQTITNHIVINKNVQPNDVKKIGKLVKKSC